MAKEKKLERQGRLYGRKWKVSIYKNAYAENGQETAKKLDKDNNIVLDVSMLRCVFNIQQVSNTPAIMCILEVYNMNAATENGVITDGWQITIEAGYEEGQYGEIFKGNIVQVIRNRENGTDYKLEIVALQGSVQFDVNHVRTSLAAGSKPRDIPAAIGKNSKKSFAVGEVSENISEQQLPRGKVLFGTPTKYLRDLAVGNNAYYWAGDDGQLTVKKLEDEIPKDHCIVLAPGSSDKKEPNIGGLVGIPQYSDEGIKIKMLLDSRVKKFSMVKIDNDWIRKQLMQFKPDKGNAEQNSQQSVFEEDGEYQVISITHSGDTHGNEWYTDIVGLSRLGMQKQNEKGEKA